MLKINLTEEQKKALASYFGAVRQGNSEGVRSAIVAQVFEDGFVAKVVSGRPAQALCSELGGNWEATHKTAFGRINAK